MVERSYPFNGGTTTDAEFSDFFRDFAPTGVRGPAGSPDLRVTADSTGLNVKVAAGRAIVRGHRYKSDAQVTLTITGGLGQPRIDTVILRLEYGSVNNVHIVVKQGEPGPIASVAPPTLLQTETGVYEFPLANVAVSASAATITPANVTDRRALYSLPNPAGVPIFQTGIGRAGSAYDGTRPLIIKTGSVVVLALANSSGSFAWPGGAFPNGLISVNFTPGDTATAATQLIVAGGTSLNQCQFVARAANGTGVGAVQVRVEFIAIGW